MASLIEKQRGKNLLWIGSIGVGTSQVKQKSFYFKNRRDLGFIVGWREGDNEEKGHIYQRERIIDEIKS